MVVTLTGIVLLSARHRATHTKTKWGLVVALIVILGIEGVTAKLSVATLAPLQTYVLAALVEGVLLLCALFTSQGRAYIAADSRVAHWAVFSEMFNWMAYLSMFFALSSLPATIVYSIAACMPVVVLLGERLLDVFVGRLVRDHLLMARLVPLVLVCVGVALLAAAGYG
jgi:uncharacterized membrane protein